MGAGGGRVRSRTPPAGAMEVKQGSGGKLRMVGHRGRGLGRVGSVRLLKVALYS